MIATEHRDAGSTPAVEMNITCPSEPNPLGDLLERAKTDVGTVFVPEILKALHDLKQSDHASYEFLRHKLKGVCVRVTELDKAMENEFGEEGNTRLSQVEILLQLAEDVKLFHEPDGTTYAQFAVNGHFETWALRSQGFAEWLQLQYYRKTEGAPSSESMAVAVNTLNAKARFEGPEEPVFVRVGNHSGKYYIDLCNEHWEVIEIDAQGWRVVPHSPVNFVRMHGMQVLPFPVYGGHIQALRRFINVRSESDFVLIVSWILASLVSKGPYPLLVISGEQGSAKSTATRIVRALTDPNKLPLRSMPIDERDLFIGAKNSHLMVFDNLSHISGSMSDALCRLSTGGGYATRKLYSNDEEMLIEATRPVLLNSIEDVVARPDLADRSIFINLDRIPAENRKSEAELWSQLEAELPRIMGTLLDAMVLGIVYLPDVKLNLAPRMADFARWGVACESALWPQGTFMGAYNANRQTAVQNSIDSNALASALCNWISEHKTWDGTATDLLTLLSAAVPTGVTKDRSWPKSAKNLSTSLRRLSPVLEAAGVMISWSRSGKARTRLLRISLEAHDEGAIKDANSASAVSAASARPQQAQSHAAVAVN